MGRFSEIQNRLNTNRLFQQTFQARQQAGQILAASPDLETGLAALYKDPTVAPFAGEIVASARQGMLAQQQLQGEQQTQASSGLQAVLKGMTGAVSDPSMLRSLIDSHMATLSPYARSRVAPAVDSITQALTSGLEGLSPEQAMAVYRQRQAALATSTSMSPDSFAIAAGKPTIIERGNVKDPGLISSTTGGFTQGSNPLTVGAPPQYVSAPGDTHIPVPAISGGGSGGGGNSLMPPQAASASSPSPAGAGARVSALEPAGDGKPLVPADISLVAPTTGKAAGGLNLLSKPQLDQAAKLSEVWGGEGLKSFNNASQSLASLKYMDNAFDTMVKGGGFLVPGAAAGFRADFAKTVNTMYQMIGKEPPFPPEKVASIEEMTKETKRMGLNVINQMLGGQREAAQIITGVTQSVPGIENTYLGGKLVSAGLQAAAQRVIDQRNFENLWQQRNQGNLTGAAEAFNTAHPAKDYATGVLDKMGMTEKGFTTPDGIVGAVKSGYLSKDQGTVMLRSQFPDQFH